MNSVIPEYLIFDRDKPPIVAGGVASVWLTRGIGNPVHVRLSVDVSGQSFLQDRAYAPSLPGRTGEDELFENLLKYWLTAKQNFVGIRPSNEVLGVAELELIYDKWEADGSPIARWV
jgi:hypothetical protein